MYENTDNAARRLNKIAFSYLLQDNSLESLLSKTDNNGWTFLHWAVADLQPEKISEYIDHNLEFSILSNDNKIPVQALKFKKNEENPVGTFMPYTEKGFSPIHLCVFLYKKYNQEDQFSSQNYSTKISKIFDMFLNNKEQYKNITDKDGNNFIDYILMSEDIKSIFNLLNADSELLSLKKVSKKTAIKIMERVVVNEKNYNDPKSNVNSIEYIDILQDSIEKIKKCILKDEISDKLTCTNNTIKLVKI